MNAYAECWVRTVWAEVTGHILIAGLRHLRTVPEQPRHCYRHRPHRAEYLRPPDGDDITLAAITDLITAGIWQRRVLDGLISEYERAA